MTSATTTTTTTTTSSDPTSVHNMEEVEKVFKRFGANGDGKISAAELGDVLRALGSSPSEGDLCQMMEEIDTDGDGFIDLKEFTEFHCNVAPEGGEMKEAFDTYDEDKDGLISAQELHRVLEKLGETCSIQDCERMINTVDSDGDGCVSFDEFKLMMNHGKASAQ